MFNRSTQTTDKKLAEKLIRKWKHEALKAVVYEGERPVTVHDAITEFLAARNNTGGYDNACLHMKRWQTAILNIAFKSVQKHQVQANLTKMPTGGYANNTIAVTVR